MAKPVGQIARCAVVSLVLLGAAVGPAMAEATPVAHEDGAWDSRAQLADSEG